MDIYSRKVIHWEIWPTETGLLAKEFIEHAIEANGGVKPRTVHADRGTSMTSDTVAGLYAKLNIAQSHSRPHVSDDNPFSEAGFKTLKYCPAFPGRFGSIQDANIFCEAFFTYYNTEHRHSGIAMHTPASVHDGSWARIHEHRTATLRAAFEAHPERFRGRCPAPRPLPAKVWINEPPAIIETTPPPQTTQAALCLIQFDRLRPDTLTTRNLLARVIGLQGRHAEAERICREILADRQRILGDDHLDTLHTRHNLAWMIGLQGRYAETEELCRKLLADRQRILGDDHPATLTARNLLARPVVLQGRYPEAEQLYRRVLADRRLLLGNNHPDTMVTRNMDPPEFYAHSVTCVMCEV